MTTPSSSTSTPYLILGSDHRGTVLKDMLKQYLKGQGAAFIDMGSHKEDKQSNYADIAHKVGQRMEQKDTGVLICKTGNGMAMAANKHTHVRAALCWNKETARLARAHNNANVLCLPASLVKEHDMLSIVNIFLSTTFEGGRHTERVSQIPLPLPHKEAKA